MVSAKKRSEMTWQRHSHPLLHAPAEMPHLSAHWSTAPWPVLPWQGLQVLGIGKNSTSLPVQGRGARPPSKLGSKLKPVPWDHPTTIPVLVSAVTVYFLMKIKELLLLCYHLTKDFKEKQNHKVSRERNFLQNWAGTSNHQWLLGTLSGCSFTTAGDTNCWPSKAAKEQTLMSPAAC